MRANIIKVLPAFFLVVLLSVIFTRLFRTDLPDFENAIQLVRKHTLTDLTLTPQLQRSFSLISSLSNFLPRPISARLWSETTIYFLLLLPIIILVSLSVISSKKLFCLSLALFLISLFPYSQTEQKLSDLFIEKTKFRLLTPLSQKFTVLWSPDTQSQGVKYFQYRWDQKNPTNSSKIMISCLGHYQLNLNGEFVYTGPVFSQFHKVYYDEIDISSFIKPGSNNISVACSYEKGILHEHQDFPHPGLIVGGFISDGIFKYTLADHRLWQVDLTRVITFTPHTFDALHSENIIFSGKTGTLKPVKIPNDLLLEPRPIPKLQFTTLSMKTLDKGVFDLGFYTLGYLKVVSDQQNDCLLNVGSFSTYSDLKNRIGKNELDDKISLPAGALTFQLPTRQAGRFIKAEPSGCHGKLEYSFVSPSYSIPHYETPKTSASLDKQIFTIADRSITNGIQDQIEDSLLRERALYIGDSYAVFHCLPPSSQKDTYFRYILNSFLDSQKPDGSFPAMAHSQNPFIIPDYDLLYPIFLRDYYLESLDMTFLKANQEPLNSLTGWIKDNLTSDGLLVDKHKAGWWIFIDWTKRDLLYQYETALQIYLVESLSSITDLYQALGLNTAEIDSLRSKAYTSLIDLGFDTKTHLFSDSFSSTAQKTPGGIITNSLAGKFGLFPSLSDSQAALSHFKGKTTSSPFSQTWLVEWALKEKDTASTLGFIRNYFGEMVKDGATSIYEIYDPGKNYIEGSHSHIWGCSPAALLNKINE